MRAHRIVPFAVLLLACGEGSDRDAGVDAGGGMDGAVSLDGGGHDAGDAGAADAGGDAGAADAGVDAGPAGGLVPVDPPPDPTFPDVIDTLSIAVRTGTNPNAGTNDPIELCVSDTQCFDLDTPDIDDRQDGLVDVFHFAGLGLPRAMVDRVTLRTRSPSTIDNDRWTPACLGLRFDGEPVYCNDAIGVHIGTGSSIGEVPSWTDPAGLHEACTTCWDRTLTHGPVQGGSESDTVRVWVRADATRPVALRMADGALGDDSPIVAWALPRPADDFTAVFEVSGLEPGHDYRYRVEVDGDRGQPSHRISTAPAPDDRSPMRFTFGSCTRDLTQPAFAPMLADEPDVFLFIGDTHYANSRHQAAHRWRYRQFRAIPERAAFLAETPTLSGWDDHDFVGNNATGTCAGRDEGLRAFAEYWANPPMGTADTPGVFYRHRWGGVELFVLDGRMYRPEVGDPERRCEDDPSPPTLDPADGLLGRAQWTWAVDAIASSDAVFKIVSCGSQWTLDGSRDSWASFPAARDAFLAELDARGVEGLVLLSGDIHRSEVRTIHRAGGAYDIPELTSSPIANVRSSCGASRAERSYCIDDDTSYLVVDVDPGAVDPSLTVRVRDGSGALRHEQTFLRSALAP